MDFALDDATTELRKTVREFAEGEVAPVAEHLDQTKSFPYDIVEKMGGLGWMGIPFPEEVGGAGGTSLQYAIAVEELTRIESRSEPTRRSAPSRSTSSARTSSGPSTCPTCAPARSSAPSA